MTYLLKIFLAGYSGAGKTTGLQQICGSNTYLFGEQLRKPTESEKKAWKTKTGLATTTTFPNYGNFYLSYNKITNKFNVLSDESLYLKKKLEIYMIDTCGQEAFYQYRKEHSFGADGIFFLIDGSLEATPENIKNVLNIYTELRSFYEGTPFPPMVIICNKQDLWQKARINSGVKGRELFYQKILNSHNNEFSNYPFVGASAKEGWGMDIAVDTLFKNMLIGPLKKIWDDLL